ncbi:MAG TPA: glutathione S-transferase family protein [Candidatus Binataceae bacterium]|nr:glutathione S-transferase family protein [Candidatus Binataceae bacterium]
MKLYEFAPAPNPRRVRMFIAEKGLKIPIEQVDLMTGQNRTPQFLAKNPSGGLPFMELDDGTFLAESVAICRYLESMHPEPRLMGLDPRDQAEVEMWNRRMELELFGPISRTLQNTHPMFKARMKQFPDYGEAQREAVKARLERMDRELEGRPFVAGDRFTIADITPFVAIEFGSTMGIVSIDPSLQRLTLWRQSIASRPSAKA